jgi:hypothetical protein
VTQKTNTLCINPLVLFEELDRICDLVSSIIESSLIPLSAGRAADTRAVKTQSSESIFREIFGNDLKKLVPAARIGAIPVYGLASGNKHQNRVGTRSLWQSQRAGKPYRPSRKLHRQVLERTKILGKFNTKNGDYPQAR